MFEPFIASDGWEYASLADRLLGKRMTPSDHNFQRNLVAIRAQQAQRKAEAAAMYATLCERALFNVLRGHVDRV